MADRAARLLVCHGPSRHGAISRHTVVAIGDLEGAAGAAGWLDRQQAFKPRVGLHRCIQQGGELPEFFTIKAKKHLIKQHRLGLVASRLQHKVRPLFAQQVRSLVDQIALLGQGLEVKSGSTFASDWPQALHKWTAMATEPVGPPRIVYGGDGAYGRQGCQVQGWQAFATEPWGESA